MDNKKGYVYILINPSHEGLVKVGKTTKDPNERAKELSASTGVPTPFVVVYKRMFKNCHLAEKIAHEILTERGCRVNDSREFFSINIAEAIDVILQIPDNDNSEVDDKLDAGNDFGFTQNDMGRYYYMLGDDYYYGNNDKFEDVDRAIFYFEKSASLGYAMAYSRLGDIWYDRDNSRRAVEYYQKAVEGYDSASYAKLGDIYMNPYDVMHNERNAKLAWSKYFDYLERHKENLLTESDTNGMYVGLNLYHYFSHYLSETSLPDEHKDFIHENKDGLISVLFATINQTNKWGDKYEVISKKIENDILPYLFDLKSIDEVITTYYPCEKALNHLFGKNDYQKDVSRALKFLIEYEEKGSIIAEAYIGIAFYQINRKDVTETAWRGFYNKVYDEIVSGNISNASDEDKQLLLDAFYEIFYCATKWNEEQLIHKFYYLTALHLGFIDYLKQKFASLALNIVSQITGDISDSEEDVYTLKEILTRINDNLQTVVSEEQGGGRQKIHRLPEE